MAQTRKYECHTLNGMDSLVLGIDSIVPRWDVVKVPDRTLQYFVQTESFPSPDDAKTAADAFTQATAEWNDLDLGLSFAETADMNAANFYLRWRESEDPEADSGVLAQAFFPNEVHQDVIVFSLAFKPGFRDDMHHFFVHELGHVLGLRHEFAPAKERGSGAVRFMEKNWKSVMGYKNFPPAIQQTDIDATQAFYKLPNGFLFGRQPVTDFVPQIRSKPGGAVTAFDVKAQNGV